MQKQFDYIVNLAKEYHNYKEDSDALFLALNNLSANELEDIHKEYADPERSFQPVTLLRAEVARLLLEGKKVNQELVEVIKEKIRNKDKTYFSSYKENFVLEMENYGFAKRDIFANWQNAWTVFHCFFYRQTVKENVQNYLEQIAKDLIAKLNVKDYKFHTVDFQGSANFGSDFCWLGLYPITKESHKDAYQFFVEFKARPQAGKMTGSDLKKPHKNNLKSVFSYNEVIECLQELKDEIVKVNNENRNYFKFSPGKGANKWQQFYNQNIIAVNYQNLGIEDISTYKSLEELTSGIDKSLQKNSNQIWNLWLFKSANIGDVVFANEGVNKCVGIGIIESDYFYIESKDKETEGFHHVRKVRWITSKVYQHTAEKMMWKTKKLFRPDTFSPTKNYKLILEQYLLSYPELAEVFEKNNFPIEIDISKELDEMDELEKEFDELENQPPNYWWLNANPKIWKINDNAEGEKQTYTTYNDEGNKRRIYSNFQEVRKGDLIIGYESTPTKQIKAIYEITQPLHIKDNEEIIEFELIEKLDIPINWSELKNNEELKECSVLRNNQGSLFRILEEEYAIFREIIDTKNTIAKKFLDEKVNKKYNFLEDQDKPFISQEQFLQTVEILKRKKNIILQGAAGVGKTFIARKLAYQIMGQTNNLNIEMVQFHQSYSYEDFIQGLRPTKTGGFEVQNGVFYDFCKKALAHPERHFFFIIDEINRGNLSKIFGELMMLIEADKRDEKFSLKLTYSEEEEDRFYIPKNLYLICTMNTADRSLAMVDYALRRRFAFVSLKPDFGEKFKSFLSQKEISETLITHISNSIQKVNQEIAKDINLGEGFQIGHSYFCDYEKEKMEEKEWFNQVIQFEIQPLLEEIWFDDSEKVREMMKILWIN